MTYVYKAKSYFKSVIIFESAIKFESENGIKIAYNGMTFDLIKRFFPTPLDTINAFDFTVSMIAVDTDELYYGRSTFLDLARNELIINKITNPVSTMKRFLRHIKKGFYMPQKEVYKVLHSLKNVKECDYDESEDFSSGDEFI